MRSIDLLEPGHLADTCAILTDMDETLTHKGRLAWETFQALEALQEVGVPVIVNTAAPAGWCDQMVRMWPIAGVIGENGGLFFRRTQEGEPVREYWHDDPDTIMTRLLEIGNAVQERHPGYRLASDQPFRLTSLAFKRGGDSDDHLVGILRKNGADVTINNLWVLAWLGGYDKLAMARRTLPRHFGFDIDRDQRRIIYLGDSENDAPMFSHFENSFGMSTVGDGLSAYPKWQTHGTGGAGFVEVARRVLLGT